MKTCETILWDLLECDFIDCYSYIAGIINNNTYETTDDGDEKVIISEFINKIKRHFQQLNTLSRGKVNSFILKKIQKLIADYSLCSEVGDVMLMKDYIEDEKTRTWLLAHLDEWFENSDSTPDKLMLPGDEAMIAKAINTINSQL